MEYKVDYLEIFIKVPKTESENWRMSFVLNGKGGHPSTRRTAKLLYMLLERKLAKFSRSFPNAEICISIKYEDNALNESIDTISVREILYDAACFLEDYLPPDFLVSKYEKYVPEE